MDPFVLIMAGMVTLLVIFVLLLGFYHPRSGNDVLDWRPTRSPEQEVQNEIDDLDQMLEAANRRRRARGEAELTEAGMRDQVAEDLRDANERRANYLRDEDLPDEDVQQMLAATNARRRARGEAEVSEADYRAQIEAEQPPDA